MRFLLWLLVAAGVAASLYLSYQIGTQAILVGSPEGRWFYFYLSSFRPTILLACAAASAAGLAALYLSERVGLANEWLVVLVWFVAAVVIEATICSLAPFPFDRIFASDGANSFNTVASHFTPGTMLGDFESVRKLWPPQPEQHAEIHFRLWTAEDLPERNRSAVARRDRLNGRAHHVQARPRLAASRRTRSTR